MKDPLVKRTEAEERNQAHQALTIEERIKKAEARPGASAREIKRLRKMKTST